jgi:Domain of unknown function (DUF1963)
MTELLVPILFLILLALLLYASVRITLKSFRNVAVAVGEAKSAPRRRTVAAPAAPATPPLSSADRKLVSDLMNGMVAQLDHLNALEEGRGEEASVVRLVLQVPIRDAAAPRSWLGGGPRLPAGMELPTIDGARADFLAQICLADVPADLWEGLGPRSGWIAMFAHPETGETRVLHLPSADVAHPPAGPVGEVFCWSQSTARDGDLPPLPRQWPQWPVELVTVRPGDPDPWVEGRDEARHQRYAAGYDVREPGLHPFDWTSLLALTDVLEAGMRKYNFAVDHGDESPLVKTRARLEARLTAIDGEMLSSTDRHRVQKQLDDQLEMIAATGAARAVNAQVRARAEEVIAIVRETHASGATFSANDAAAVVDALGAAEWMKVVRDSSSGAERVTTVALPLTRHDKDCPLWVYDYDIRHAELAKRAYCADPASLPAAQRAHYEPIWQALARIEMPSMGHVPIGYVHEFDDATDVTLIEIPTGHLLNWMFSDCHHLVLTMKKADLAAGNWDRVPMQVSN